MNKRETQITKIGIYYKIKANIIDAVVKRKYQNGVENSETKYGHIFTCVTISNWDNTFEIIEQQFRKNSNYISYNYNNITPKLFFSILNIKNKIVKTLEKYVGTRRLYIQDTGDRTNMGKKLIDLTLCKIKYILFQKDLKQNKATKKTGKIMMHSSFVKSIRKDKHFSRKMGKSQANDSKVEKQIIYRKMKRCSSSFLSKALQISRCQ